MDLQNLIVLKKFRLKVNVVRMNVVYKNVFIKYNN